MDKSLCVNPPVASGLENDNYCVFTEMFLLGVAVAVPSLSVVAVVSGAIAGLPLVLSRPSPAAAGRWVSCTQGQVA